MKIDSIHFLFYLFVFFLFCTFPGKAQEQDLLIIDSLKKAILTEKQQQKIVDNNNQIAYTFASINIDSTLYYIEKASELAQKINYKKGIAECHYYNARSFIQKGELTKAIESYNESLKIYNYLNDTVNILNIYRGLSYAYSYSASQIISLDYSLKALEIAEELKDSLSLSVIYNNIAAIYHKLDNYESAVYYFQKTLELDLISGKSPDIAITYSNLGMVKVENGNFEEAVSDYSKLKAILPDIESDYVRSYIYLSFAGYHTGLAEYDSANYYITLADHICSDKNYLQIQTRVYRRTGELLFKQKRFEEAISYFDKSIELAKSIQIFEKFPTIYNMKAIACSELGRFEEAYYNSQEGIRFRDSLQNKKIAVSLAEFENEHKLKLEKELLDQQAKNTTIQLKFKLRLAIVTSALLLISIVIFIYFFLRQRKSKLILQKQHAIINEQKSLIEDNFNKLQLNEQKLQKLNATKDKLFSIVAHDLRSPFNALLGFSNELSENYESYDDKLRKKMISLISASSESTLFLLENLLNWARSQSESIMIQKGEYNLKKLIEESISPYLGSAEIKLLHLNNFVSDNIKIWGDKEILKVVISNLFSNAIKFSHKKGEIIISCTKQAKLAEVCIQDSGIGMNKKITDSLFTIDKNTSRIGTLNEKGTGLGLILCREFIQMNDGTIRVKSEENKGSTFCITIPLAEV
ncbi:tetratricopeptide repeat protein [Prolixibacteraceae bacterium Z1-6]|uniref:histidine kinase n=1 Tax=Draconibacterium aestuarii TaxID=2998507 RepID=A0A9X3J6G7_9BACT|nr:tetratricopeptide repeat protein [Prolixibacteraceae bacterium Z1-6]